MLKQLVGIVLPMILVFGVGLAPAAQGEAIFKAQGCMTCHNPDKGSKVNPSLRDIAQAYSGQGARLVQYLQGQSEALVNPEKAAMMKRQIEKTKALSEPDRQALVDFIMSHTP
jgi:cytochrome c